MGNGCTDPEYDGNALVPFAYGMSLISLGLYSRLQEHCGGNFWNNTDGSRFCIAGVYRQCRASLAVLSCLRLRRRQHCWHVHVLTRAHVHTCAHSITNAAAS